MHYLLYLLILLAAAPPALSQQLRRESVPRPQIGEELARLENATGWVFSSDQQWISAQNKIPNPINNLNRFASGSFSLGLDTFRYISIRTIDIVSDRYDLVIVSRNDGAYEYPAIYEGWNDHVTWYWYVLERGSLESLLPPDFSFNEAYTVNLHTIYCGVENNRYGDRLTLSRLADDIVEAMPYSSYCSDDLNARIFPVELDGQKQVRFYFFKDDGRYYLPGGPLPDGVSEADPEAFDHHYYETSFSNFSRLTEAGR